MRTWLVPVNSTDSILKAYGQRFRHIHLHDNRAGSVDIHLRLGANGYDGTIRLKVFTPDREYLRRSRICFAEPGIKTNVVLLSSNLLRRRVNPS